MVNKPGFLIIGALKAGTTTLYDDLCQVPGLYLPPEKEPEDLLDPSVETPAGQARYFAKFKAARAGDICGEASTAYAKRPTFNGIAARACAVLGPELKLIYLVRDPIQRLTSQYHHQWGLGLETRPLDEAVRHDNGYRDYSRYDWQLEPWRASFSDDAILVVAFEHYIADRAATIRRICAHLGVDFPGTGHASHKNRTSGKAFVPRGGMLERVMQSRLYQFGIKPLLSHKLRERIKFVLLPKTPELSATLSRELHSTLRAFFEDDAIARHYSDDMPADLQTFNADNAKLRARPSHNPDFNRR